MKTNRIEVLLEAQKQFEQSKIRLDEAKRDLADLNRSLLKEKGYTQRELGVAIKNIHGIAETNAFSCCNPNHSPKGRPSIEMLLTVYDVIQTKLGIKYWN